MAKNAPEFPSKYLIDRICKIKEYLNYIHWWYKSKYSSSPKGIPKSAEKENYENSTPRRQLPKLQLLNFIAKFLTEKKISNDIIIALLLIASALQLKVKNIIS